jgi:hypothetical protein
MKLLSRAASGWLKNNHAGVIRLAGKFRLVR